jgi:lambda repressor-like predicted transcriptional regulator
MTNNESTGSGSVIEGVPAQSRLGAALLIIMTLIFGMICIGLLSATLTQTRISSLAVDGVPISLWKLNNVGGQWATIRAQGYSLSQDLSKAELKRNDLAATQLEVEQSYQRSQGALLKKLEDFDNLIKPKAPKLFSEIANHSISEQVIGIRQSSLLTDFPDFRTFVDQIEKDYETYLDFWVKRDAAKAAVALANENITRLNSEISAAEASALGKFDLIKPNLDKDARTRIENAFYELYFNTSFAGQFITKLVTISPDVLTLLLVVGMGILGSGLQLTHAIFKDGQIVGLGEYFVRLSVGAITALIIFIVAKSGVPVITDPSKLGGDAPINPYFISFLAIISGMLSENAISNIQAYGAKFVGGQSAEPSRWARQDLNAELTNQGLPLASLANYLGVDQNAVTPKLKGQVTVTPEEQRIISLYLRREQRDLFTDIPPAST